MRRIVERIAEGLTAAISAWDTVECVILCEQAEEDVLDPYFALVVDVYHRGPVPAPETRRAAFGDPGAFESASVQPKDRFFLEGLPIRVEYKSVAKIEEILTRGADILWLLKDTGTYVFYRLERGHILWQRSEWLREVRAQLLSLDVVIWEGLRESFQNKMEHYLADLGAATMMGDDFFLLVSSAGFARYAAATIFMINRRFEPSHRSIESHLRKLSIIPDDFFGRWEMLLRTDGAFSPEQKHKVAELIAKSIVSFG